MLINPSNIRDGACLLTRMPSQRDTARRGRRALSVLIERIAGIPSSPTQTAPRFIRDNYIQIRRVRSTFKERF